MDQRKSQLELLNVYEKENENKWDFVLENALRRRRPSNVAIESNTQSEDDEKESPVPFESKIVIEFSKQINHTSLHWIIDKIRMTKSNGGAQLQIRKEPDYNQDKGLVIHISANRTRILELADEIGFNKQTKQGMKNFNMGSLDEFVFKDDMTVDDILTPAEKQIAVKYALENIKATMDEKHIPGSNSTTLYQGQSIIHAALADELIVDLYSLHDKIIVKRLGNEWWNVKNILKPQPIDKVRFYFGDAIGIYFSFVGFYTQALIYPTICGFLQYLFNGDGKMYFCCFYVIWMTIFLELWKRKCCRLAYNWGSLSLTTIETPRPEFYGILGQDPVTGKRVPQYPMWKTLCQFYLVSVPIMVLASLGMAFMAMSQFWIEDYLTEIFSSDSYILLLPSIVQAMVVAILTIFYDKFTTYLTIKENHRTQSQYEKYRVNKLILLEFVNNFFSLFYIAFVKRDNKMLKNQLMTQMIVLQFVQNIQEFLLPKLKQKFNLWCCCNVSGMKNGANIEFTTSQFDDLHIQELKTDDPKIVQNIRESAKDVYETYDDYLELYIQFGYVVLFSSIVPFAAFWALLNNFIEIRLDAYKLCKTFRRPLAKRTKNTGAWQKAFEVLACLSIITNCGILYLNSELREWTIDMSEEKQLLIFIGIEHFMLLFAFILHKAIPDRPKSVQVALARADYESKQALKRESFARTKNIFLRRFKSVMDD